MIVAYAQREKARVDYGDFYINRFARIYPIYVIALLLSTNGHLKGIFSFDFLLQATLLQSWVPGHVLTFNIPGWSLSNEAFFYLSFPLLLNYLYKKVSVQTTTFILIAAFFILKLTSYILYHSSFYKGFPSPRHDFVSYFPAFNISDFLLGNILGLWFLKIPKTYFRNYDIPVILTVVVAFFMMGYGIGLNYISFVFAGLILFLSLNTKGYITRLFSMNPLVLLGEASFGIYILMGPLFSLVAKVTSKLGLGNAKSASTFYISLVVLIAASIISYKLIEIPARNFIKTKWTNKKLAANA